VASSARKWLDSPFTALAIGGLLLAAHVFSLGLIPAPFVDEAWFADRAWSLLSTGYPLGTLDYGVVHEFNGAAFFFPLLPVTFQAAAFAVTGEPSLMAVRAVSLGAGVTVAFAVWVITASYYDRATALLSIVLVALSYAFIVSSHLARYDIIAAAFGYGGIALLVWSRKHRRGLAGLAGFITGLAVECHPFALVFAIALAAVTGDGLRTGHASRREAWHLAAGLAVGGLVYPIIHILPDPASYYALSRIIYGPTHVPAIADIWTGLHQAVTLSSQMFQVHIVVVTFALFLLGWSGERRDRDVAILATGLFLAFVVVVRNKIYYYAILFVPVFAIATAAAVRGLVLKLKSPVATSLVLLVLTLQCAGALIGASVWLRAGDARRDLLDAVDRLSSSIAPGESVMGSQTYWFGLNGRRYYSWEQLVYLTRANPGMSITGALARMRPDIFIRDEHLDYFIVDGPGATLYQEQLKLPRSELEGWLADHAAIVADFQAGRYGRIRAYRLNWHSPASSIRAPDSVRPRSGQRAEASNRRALTPTAAHRRSPTSPSASSA
jgi:hypothetical protein